MLADEVFAWLSQQPAWQRDLARRLAGCVELDQEGYAAALAMIRKVFGLPVAPAPPDPQPITRAALSADGSAGAERLVGLGGFEGVGLIGEGEQLTFAADGLTIVYGQNAAGKSTYVRALKKLCRSVDADCVVLGNVFSGAPAAPSVRVQTRQAGQLREQRTSLDDDTSVRLTGLSVFDTRCAELYVDAQNTVQYIPTELRLLSRLALLQDRLRHSLEEERDSLLESRPPTDVYPPNTAVGAALRGLTGRDSDANLDALAEMTPEERARRAELSAAVAAAATSTTAADAAAAEREAAEAATLAASVGDLSQRISEEAATRLRSAANAHGHAQEAVRLAAEQLSGPVGGIGSEPWRLLWQAARDFVELHQRSFPPASGEPCPLCLQEVSDAAAARLALFETHVASTVQAVAAQREREYEHAREHCDPEQASRLGRSALLIALRDREPSLAASVGHVIAAVEGHLTEMRREPAAAKSADVDVSSASRALAKWGEDRRAHAEVLAAAADAGRVTTLKAELDELAARERLGAELDKFKTWRNTLGVLAKIDAARTALATNRITSAQRSLIADELGKRLDAALTAELKALRCSLPVRIHTETARAETSVGLRLLADTSPKVSQIASEGERRALALSFFFAELEIASDQGGVVVDDPVSSLDDERRIYVAARLVDEAARRQVIVFTHDLPFVFELRSAAKGAGVEVLVQHVWRQGQQVGRVDEHPPFKAMNLRERTAKLETEVEEARKNAPADNDAAWRQVEGFYKRLRTSWERAVEERLFAGVVERFERDVKTLKLKDVNVTPELIAEVEEGMTRASRYIHEDAYAAQVPLPSNKDMADDVEKLRAFERLTKPKSG